MNGDPFQCRAVIVDGESTFVREVMIAELPDGSSFAQCEARATHESQTSNCKGHGLRLCAQHAAERNEQLAQNLARMSEVDARRLNYASFNVLPMTDKDVA